MIRFNGWIDRPLGTTTIKYNYDAWGKLISATNANGVEYPAGSFAYQNSVRYRGYVYDQETGLYYLQSRYYDPETGRFINADDPDYLGASGSVLSYNAFAYCENNPVNSVDCDGYFKGNDHKEETVIIAKRYFAEDIAQLLGEASKSVDELYPPVKKAYSTYDQSFHFNTNYNSGKQGDSREERAKELFDLGSNSLDLALKYKRLLDKNQDNRTYRINFAVNTILSINYFGMSIHPLQDKVAHCGPVGDMPFTVSLDGVTSFVAFRFHLPFGVDDLDSKYPLDKSKTRREVNEEVTERQLKKIQREYMKRGLYSYVK